jgi:1-acyl-sn-glycerol-3-phosphate acyltransferase
MRSSYPVAVLYRAPGIALSTILMGSLSLIVAFWDTHGNVQLEVARWWARMLLWFGGARVTVEGLERLDRHASYVVCPNHVSYMDTPVLLTHIPVNFRFLAKKELFSIPFIGGHLKRAGNICVPLDDPRGSVRVLAEAGKAMRERGLSMLVFPEGGRSEDGTMQPFKDGAAFLAIKAQVPMVPVVLVGIRDVLPMHSHFLRPGKVRLLIGDPIPTAGLHTRDRADLTTRLYETMLAMQKAAN